MSVTISSLDTLNSLSVSDVSSSAVKTMLKLEKLTKKYNNNLVIKSIDLQIKKGEVVGLLGPNGAGKTTLMKLITGYLVPDSGNVYINNKKINFNDSFYRSKIGYMPETNPLPKDKYVMEMLNLALDLHGNFNRKFRSERIDYVIKATSLEKVAYKPISELSKGYRQRLGLAIALINDPEILILDEPTEGLDPNQRIEIRSLIKKLGEDRTVLISTHVMAEVESMCNRVLIINAGEVIADDTTQNILKRNKGNIEVVFIFKQKNFKISQLDGYFDKSDVNLLSQKNDVVELIIKSHSNDELMVQITRYIRENENLVVHSISKKQYSLEDIFRDLTA